MHVWFQRIVALSDRRIPQVKYTGVCTCCFIKFLFIVQRDGFPTSLAPPHPHPPPPLLFSSFHLLFRLFEHRDKVAPLESCSHVYLAEWNFQRSFSKAFGLIDYHTEGRHVVKYLLSQFSIFRILLSKFLGMKFHLENEVTAESFEFERFFALIDRIFHSESSS